MRFAGISFSRVETVLDFGCFVFNRTTSVAFRFVWFRFVSPRRRENARTTCARAREREKILEGVMHACDVWVVG